MMPTVKIEKRVPVPPTGKTTGMMEAMRTMKVGDSFALPQGLQPYSTHAYAKTAGIKITVKKQKDGYRVWRIA
jgi:hypothetical protein